MNNKISVLLKSLLLSTSSINKIKYGNNQKRKKAITDLAGISIIYISLLVYCLSTCIGYGKLGLTGVIPTINIITISTCSFIFTFFKGGSYLFLFKDYDMLMSLPFSVKQIVAGKFLCMYINSLPFMMCISISMLIGYCIFAPFNLITIIWWIILSIISPIIPTVIAALISSLILIVSSRFKYKKFIQTLLSYLLVLFCFSLEFIIGGAAPNGEFDELLKNLASQLDNTKKIYIPALWFENKKPKNKIEELELEIMKKDIEIARLKKGYKQVPRNNKRER